MRSGWLKVSWLVALLLGESAGAGERNFELDGVHPADARPIRLVRKAAQSAAFEAVAARCQALDVQQEGAAYTQLSLPGGARCGETGEPQLPCYGQFVEVPAGMTVRLVVDQVTWGALPGRFDVLPRQPPPTDKAGDKPPRFTRHKAAYGRDEFIPAQPVRIVDQMCVRGRSLVYVSYTPLLYNAARQEVKTAARVQWHLDYAPAAGARARAARPDRVGVDAFAPLMADVLDAQPPAADAPAAAAPDLATTNGADYLVVTHDSFYTNVLPLAQWKHAKGFQTRVVKTSEISATPNCTNITAYISNAYATWSPRPTYVLLVGDSGFIPAWYKTLHSYYGTYAATDLYYSTVDGSDYFPDLLLGRLPCATTAQCDLMVSKILNVEKTPNATAAMYRTLLTSGEYTDSGGGYEERIFVETAEAIRDFHQVNGYTVNTSYCSDTTTTPRHYNSGSSLMHTNGAIYGSTQTYVSTAAGTAAISSNINAGVWLVQHRDHGSQTGGWATPPYSPTTAGALTNGTRLPVVMSINCETAWFDGGSESLAESFLKNTNGGSHAVIGATRVSYSWYNDWFVHGLYECMYTNYFETLSGLPYYKPGLTYSNNYVGHGTHLGQILNFGKILMYEKEGAGTVTQIEFDILTLLGDPEQSPRNAVPKTLAVTHPAQLSALAPASFTVTVTSGGVPVPGALVALVCDPGDYHKAYTDASGVAAFSFTPQTPLGNTNTPMAITVSEQNAIPYQGTMTLATKTIQLTLPAYATEGDGLLGAQGQLAVNPAPADDVTVTLVSSDAGELLVPASVLVPAGQTNVTFDLTVGDDALADGSQYVTVTASAEGYSSAQAGMTILDSEVPLHHFAWSTVTSPQILDAPFAVVVTAYDYFGGVVSNFAASVSLAGADANAVPITPALSGSFVGGSWTGTVAVLRLATNMTLTAVGANGHAGTSSVFSVQATADLALSLTAAPASVGVGEVLTYTVIVSNRGPQRALSVGLTVPLPGTVTYLGTTVSQGSCTQVAGVVSCALGDLANGAWATVTITVSPTLAGALSGSASLSCLCTDPNSANNTGIAGNTATGGVALLSVTPATNLTAVGLLGGPFLPASQVYALTNAGTGYLDWQVGKTAAWLTLSASTGTLAPQSATNLTVSINAGALGLPLGLYTDTLLFSNLSSGAGSTTRAASLTVTAYGPLDHFDWSAIGSPQLQNTPFPVTLTAQDAGHRTVSNFTSVVSLSGVNNSAVATNNIGNGAASWNFPLYTYYHDARTQVIYLPSELGGARQIGALALDVTTLPGQTMSNWTIRLKHSALTNYASAAWDGSGWTTVYQAHQTIASTGWVNFVFSQPFSYDGISSLLIDFSFNNSSWTASGASRYTSAGQNRALYYYTDSGYGDPLAWSGSTPVGNLSVQVPNIRLTSAGAFGVSPTNTGAFMDGRWSGNLTALEFGSNFMLRASDGAGHSGTSSLFHVTAANADLALAMTASQNPIHAGSNLIYYLTITNLGPATASAVMLTDTLPALVTFVSAAISQGSVTQSGGVVTCNLGSLASGAVATVTLVVTPFIEAGLLNTATVSTSALDTNLLDNSATVATTVYGTGLLAVSPPSYNFGTLLLGATSQTSFVVSNYGGDTLTGTATLSNTAFTVVSGGSYSLAPGTATNVVIRFLPASNLSYSTSLLFVSSGGSATSTVTGTGGSMPVASFSGTPLLGAAPLTVTFTDNSTGTISNRCWTFGDGTSSNTTLSTLAHTYAWTGTNTVTLQVSGILGDHTLTRTNFVTVLSMLTNDWMTAADGGWQMATNWSLGIPPAADQWQVQVTNANNKTVTLNASVTNLPAALTINNLLLSAPAGTTNTLLLDNVGSANPLRVLNGLALTGSVAVTLKNAALQACGLSGASNRLDGSIAAQGSTLLLTNAQTYLGYGGLGQLSLSNSTAWVRNLTVGYLSGSRGAVTVDSGPLTLCGSNLTTLSTFYLGYNAGSNQLTVIRNAKVNNAAGYIGYGAGATNNAVTISGAGSVWSNTSTLYLGYNGAGNQLSVGNSGKVHSSGSYIGYNASATNNVATVSGVGSVWTNTSSLYVGNSGAGSQLAISNSARVCSVNGYIGYNSSASNNAATITGSGSMWTNSSSLYVGNYGAGNQLTILNSGKVFSATGYMGSSASASNNTATITGAGSIWSNTSNLYLGNSGAASQLTVSNSGKAYSYYGYMGYNASASNNVATITGAGSIWSNNYSLYLGYNSVGNQLTLTNGGKVYDTYAYIGYNSRASNNTVLISGAGSVWTNINDLHVGFYGVGNQLTLVNSGKVYDAYGQIGCYSNANQNAASVIGPGSVWTNRSDFYTGNSGAGNQLTVSSAGVLYNNNGYIGNMPGADNNAALVKGAGSLWNNTGVLYVGNYGTNNSLTIADGGKVQALRTVIGQFATGNQLVLSNGTLNSAVVEIHSNNTLLGYGTVSGSLLNSGTLLATSSTYPLTVLGPLYSEGALVATNGCILDVWGPVILAGTTNFDGGTVIFHGGILTTQGATNQWQAENDGGWEQGAYWSRRVAPSVADSSVLITNAGNKRVTVNATTFAEAPGSVTNYSLIVAASGGATNTLWVENLPLEMPFALNNLSLDEGGQLVVSNAAVKIGLVMGVLTVDGGVCLESGWLDATGVAETVVGKALSGCIQINGGVFTANQLDVGQMSPGNRLIVAGGTLGTANAYIGYTSNAHNNAASIIGTGSVWSNSANVRVGYYGAGNLLTIAGGAALYNAHASLGYNAGADSNAALVTGAGSLWSNTDNRDVGTYAAYNQLTVADGGLLINVNGYIGWGTAACYNAVLVTDPGSAWSNSASLYTGYSGGGNQLSLNNQGRVYNTSGFIGYNVSATNSAVIIGGAGSVWSNTATLFVGYSGAGSQLAVTNGGKAHNTAAYIGYNVSASNCAAMICGAGSLWSNTSSLYLGYNGAGNQLLLATGGTVYAQAVTVGLNSSSTNNTLALGGGNLVTTNAGAGLLEVRRGNVTMDSGNIRTPTVMLTNGLAGMLSMSGGTLQANTITSRGGANLVLAGGVLGPLNTNVTWSAALVLNGTVTINTADVTGQPRSVNLTGALSGDGGLDVLGIGVLFMNGTATGNRLIRVFNGATLGGTGTVATVQVLSGGTLAAGTTVGTLAATNVSLGAGAHVQVGLNATGGVAGVDWDLISVAGSVTLDGLSSSSPLRVDVFNAGGLTGTAPPTMPLRWTFLTAAGDLSGYLTNGFAFTITGLDSWSAGVWSVAQVGQSLQLVYDPDLRIIALSGDLDFGSVMLGATNQAVLTLSNGGNTTLTVTNISYPAGFSGAWAGTLAPGASTNVTVVFAPVAVTNYGGTVTVYSDATSGSNTLVVSGIGIPADQFITFPAIGAQVTTNVVALGATASSGLPVSYAVVSGPGSLAGDSLSFTGAGVVSVLASQSGNGNWIAAPNVTNTFSVSKTAATVVLGALSQTYDGTARRATATTVPAGLTVDLTYNGGALAPTNAGSYAVTGTVNSVMYQGWTNGTLVVGTAAQIISFPAIGAQMTTNVVVLGATASSGLPVSFAVASGPGSLSAADLSFTGAGVVSVVATQPGNGNWSAAPGVTNSISVGKTVAGVTLGNLSQTYDGTARMATAATVPDGLAVDLTYNGGPLAPTNAGSYAVTGTVNSVLYAGWTNGTLEVTARLTAEANPTNGGSASGTGLYAPGSHVMLVAIASNNWLFTAWNDGSTNSAHSVLVPVTNVTYTAQFAPAATLSVGVNTNAGGSVTGAGTFLVGSTNLLTATASNGWQFICWSDGETNATRYLVATSNATYSAIFAPTAVLTVLSQPTEGGFVTGGGTYVTGSNALLVATASNLWRFMDWSDGETNPVRTVEVPAGGSTYAANFAPLGAVQVLANPTHGGNVTGAGLYLLGSNAMVTATASNGWLFANWNNTVTDNPWTFPVVGPSAVCTANFARFSTVLARASPTNAGSVLGGGNYIIGSNATLAATASNNWLFTRWNDDSEDNPRTITVPATDITYTASFAAAATISVGANTNDGGYVTGSGVYFVGSNDVLTATASNNWRFIRWTDGVTNNPRTVLVGASGASYTAVFAQTAALTALANPVDGGRVTGAGTYVAGSNAVLTATASNGWRFISWNDGVTNTPRTVVVPNAGATYTANFQPLGTVVVLANPISGGRATGGGVYLAGSNATVTATASNTWRFLNWNGTVTNNPWTFTVVSGSTTCTANFGKTVTVTTLASPAGGGMVTGGGVCLSGSNATLSATAASQWVFSRWNDGNTNASRSITVPVTNITYTATFLPPVTVTVKANPTTGGSVSGGGTFQVGSNVNLTATPFAGWLLTAWNDGNTNLTRAITVPAAPTTCTANFTRGIGAAVDATNLTWATGGSASWSVQSTTTHDGVAALKSGAIGVGQQTWFQATTNGPGSLMFWWKVSSASNNYLQFYINTQLVSQIAGNVGWNQYVGYIGMSNPVTLKWVYSNSNGAASGSNAGWVDQINWMPCPYAEHVPLIFYQDPAGLLASWVVGTNASFQFARILANTGGWALKCAGDVDGDTVSDLLFQNAAGDAAGWFMKADGSTRSARYWFNLSGWDIKACGDYEGLGRGQLFFQNAAGVTAYWRLDTNGNYLAAVPVGSMGAWKLRGVGDLDGDHKAELFWQKADGTVVIWYHNPDGSIRGGVPFNTGNWALCGVADIDADGVSDLVWQNSAGLTGGWFMNTNGTARSASYWWGTGAWKLKAAGR